MKQHSVSDVFDLPQFAYFQFGNTFTGSHGTLSFQIIPGDELTVHIWHSRLCSEKAEFEATKTYPMAPEGYRALLRWLEEQVDPTTTDTP